VQAAPRRPPPERLLGARFVLRCFEPGDGPALAEAIAASTEHLRPWMAWALPVPTPAESEQVVRRFRADWLADRDFTLGIWSPDGARVLGGTGFHLRGRPVGDAVAEIGMWVRADEAGRGLGSEVLAALLRWGFTDWPWERLAWHCDERNVASARTAERAGMRLEGRLRGDKPEVGPGRRTTLVYGLTRTDPLPGG
jgi:RimJ/RimL family protein N-acetyltransferase